MYWQMGGQHVRLVLAHLRGSEDEKISPYNMLGKAKSSQAVVI